jgi:uncharacterized protein involved in outer membrane biogenesis
MTLRIWRVLGWAVVAVVAAVLLAGIAAWRLTRPERVRASLEREATTALGEPVAIGGLGISWFPRVSLRLDDVQIGRPARVRAAEVDVSAGLRGLFRRRVEDAELTIRNSRIDLPALIELAGRLSAPSGRTAIETGAPSFSVVSVRSIALDQVTLIAAGRAVVASAGGTLEGSRVRITRLRAQAPATRLSASGDVALAPVSAAFRVEAEQLDVDELVAFVAGAVPGDRAGPAARSEGGVPIVVDATAKDATVAGVRLSNVATHVTARGDLVRLDPLGATLFGGRLNGHLVRAVQAGRQRLQLSGSLAGADASQVLGWLGQARDTVTGRLSGSVQLSARGDATSAGAWRGTAHLELRDGVAKGLSIVRRAVVAFAGRAEHGDTAGTDHYERIIGTFNLGDDTIDCRDLSLASRDLDLRGSGNIRLPQGALDLHVQCLLSPELSAQAGRDLYRYAREGDRVVLPATITGALGSPSVSIDTGDAVKRALRNKVQEEAGSLLNKLFKRPKP